MVGNCYVDDEYYHLFPVNSTISAVFMEDMFICSCIYRFDSMSFESIFVYPHLNLVAAFRFYLFHFKGGRVIR